MYEKLTNDKIIKDVFILFENNALMFFTPINNNKMRPISSTFFQNVSHGVSLMASPKQPQSVTLL